VSADTARLPRNLRGMQPNGVRLANQRAILTVMAVEPGSSNADLARRTGLAPQTVSSVLTDLERAQLITRGEVRRGKRGQPATPMFLSPTGAFAVGAEIGWTHIEVVLIGLTGQAVGRYRREYDYPDAQSVFGELAIAVVELIAKLTSDEKARLIGIGLAAPGGIGETSAIIPPPGNQSALWAAIDIEQSAADATGLDVHLFNDGNAACWGELTAHPAPRPQSFAFLLIDTFVAAGIIAEGRLWEGVTGASANLGSMLVTDRQGAARFVHEIASLYALRRRLVANGLDLPAVMTETLSPEAERIFVDWIEDASFAIAQTILNTATVIEFETAIVEAVLPRPGLVRLIDAIKQQIGLAPSLGRGQPAVEAGHLGRSGAAQGAAQLRLYRRFFSRDLQHMDD
jgi:predicted NBD/HSP70 family sugar kinase